MRGIVAGWLSLEVIAVVVPIGMALQFGTGPPETFWSNLLVITGSQAATTIVVAVLFASRLKVMTRTLGLDASVSIHRALGSSAVVFIFIHLAAVVVDYPPNAWLVDLFQTPARALAGLSALGVLLLMLVLANKDKTEYERWRLTHRLSAILAVEFIAWHIIGLGQLIATTPWFFFFLTIGLCAVALPLSRLAQSTKDGKYIVRDIRVESPTASTICLTPLKDGQLKFEAGQFVWVRLRSWVWAEDHPFTISSSAHNPNVEITFRHIGNWTLNSLAELRPGRRVWLNGPHGLLSLDKIPTDRNIALIAAGVGMTSAMSIMRTLVDRGDPRIVNFLIPPAEPLFRSELVKLDEQLDNLVVFPILARPILMGTFRGVIPNPAEWAYFVCGPGTMVSDCCAALSSLDVPENMVFVEQFKVI